VPSEHDNIMKRNDTVANNQGDVMEIHVSAASDTNNPEGAMKTNEAAASDHEDYIKNMSVTEASMQGDLITVKALAAQCVKDVMKAVKSSPNKLGDEINQRVIVDYFDYFEGKMNITSPNETVISPEETQQLSTITREELQPTPSLTSEEPKDMPSTPNIIITGSEGDGTDTGVSIEKEYERGATATKLYLDESAVPNSKWEEIGPRESTPVNSTRRSLSEARRQFFNQTQSATHIGEGHQEGTAWTHSGDRCRQPRRSIGGGPLERMRTIEGSNAKQNLSLRHGTEV